MVGAPGDLGQVVESSVKRGSKKGILKEVPCGGGID